MLGLFRGCNQVQASDLLGKIHCPVRALWGEHDVVSPFDDARGVLEQFGVESTLIPRCGHSPMYESPEIFAEWVNQCLLDSGNFVQAA